MKKTVQKDFGNFGVFFVALKIMLWNRGRILILRDTRGLDFPGGRIDNTEYETPLERIIAREIREELGAVRYTLGKPAFQYRRYHDQRRMNVFVTVFEATYRSGSITLSDEHISYEWLRPKDVRITPASFSTRDEYRAFKKYLAAVSKKA